MARVLDVPDRTAVGATRKEITSRCSVLRPNGPAAEAEKRWRGGVTSYRDPALLALASLANGPKGPAEMIDDIAGLSGMRLRAGRLNRVIAGLLRRGCVESPSAARGGECYRMTIAGLHAFREMLSALRECSKTWLDMAEAS
jgi:hypothetical protein